MAVPLPLDHSTAAFTWFTEFQRSCILKNGIVPGWFHGVLSRKAAEDMLMCKPPGYFLIRVSESRVGYTLSYRADDRCRHFMIDVLPDNQYNIVGESAHYSSLHDLVAFHRRNPIVPYSEVLTVACEQGDKNNYAELLFPQRRDGKPGLVEWINPSTQAHEAHSGVLEPKLTLPTPFQNELPVLPMSPTARLYPSLETELTGLKLQSTDQQVKPVPKPRTVYTIITQDTPPQLPSRSHLPSRPQVSEQADRLQGLMQVSPEKHQITHTEGRTQQKHQQQVKPAVLSLVHIKKKLKKKRSEEHMYAEITDNVCPEDSTFAAFETSDSNPKQPVENDYEELPEYQTTDSIPNFADTELPLEYLNPPPFAPGY